ncbi:MAG: metallophosphoesterase family protein [Phaeodactylibacter sp.]|nr:metallophosphoesterase family protein [Phaeodactylibacter sp.]MCB9275343.1 metallophosphoesterase family protein [Lewinellaceae bacterium]
MKRIGLLSDTHSFLSPDIFTYFEECDEVWHAGDIGDEAVASQLEAFRPLRAVFGNIDGPPIRRRFPEDLRFECEGVDVFMTHIGGYPGRYNKRVRDILRANPPRLFICGHSHILKVMPDRTLGLLHINPGAAGREGFHKVRTIIRFSLEAGNISDLQVVELGMR